jgi:hypothetical protein
MQQSETFNNAYWNKRSGTTITADNATAPNGTMTADTANYTSGDGYIWADLTLLPSTNYVVSVYAKGGGTIQLAAYWGTGSISSSAISLTSNWQRLEFSFTTGSTTSLGDVGFFITATCNIWGAQLNIGSTAKPYFPTTDRLNVPRLTYQNGGGGCPSLLLEKQSTNVMLYSEDFTNAAYILSTASVSANTTISPDGTQNADSVTFSGFGVIEQLILYAAGNLTHTISVWAKVASGTQLFKLKITQAGVINYYSGDFTATTTWQRFTFTQAFGSGGIGFYAGVASTDSTIQLWGLQLEPNTSYVTSYIPTTSASATRVADACFKTGISSLIGASAGTLFLYADIEKHNDADFYIAISNGASLGDAVYLYQPSNGNLQVLTRKTGNADGVITIADANWVAGLNKVAIAYTATTIEIFINGVSKGSTTFTALPTLSQLTIGSRPDSVGNLVGTGIYSEAILFKTRLTNSELAQLTGNQNYTINQAYASYGVASESPNCVQP